MRVNHVFLRQIAYRHAGAYGHGARRGLDQAEHYAQEGGFSASVRPCYGHKVAFGHRQIHIFKDCPAIAAEADASEGDYVIFLQAHQQ